MLMPLARKLYESLTHFIGRVTGKYYFEDHVRVYPDGLKFDRFGRKVEQSENDRKNYLNHRKYYHFVAQFVSGKNVADIGCGSGYGCEILHTAGAGRVCGADISTESIAFARANYGEIAEFSVQGITDLHGFPDAFFDITTCSEVMEHIKEYGMEGRALSELRRITAPGGLIIVGTPNSEMLGGHGFSFEEMDSLFRDQFTTYCIFENALVPTGEGRVAWEGRVAAGRTGVVITEEINLSETVLENDVNPGIKVGIAAGMFSFAEYEVNTGLLHNTHSWIVLAQNKSDESTT